MSAAPIAPRITVEEFLRRPARMDGMQEELIDGEIFVCPNAKPLHTEIANFIFRKLIPLEETGRWLVRGETAFRLTKESLPNTDICVMDRESWLKTLAANEYPSYAPALAIEVKSPGNRPKELRKKAALYLDYGAQQVWIVQPESRNVLVLFQEDDDRVVGEGGTLVFDGHLLSVKDIFTA